MARVVFLPDLPLDRPGDRFAELAARLGLADYAVDGDLAGARFVAFVGRERAERELGRSVRSGRQDGRLEGAEVWVLPSTAPERRGSFYEGVWREFASRVLDRDLAVRDEFKGMAPDEIRAALAPRRFPFGVAVANVFYDFNLGTVIRNANAFLAREVFVYGRKRTDLRGAMGSHVYESIVHVPDAAAFDRVVADRGYSVVCFEQTPDAVPLPEFAWPDDPLLVFGQEGPGIPQELRERAHHTVVIPQYGSIRSLNVGSASAVAMYAYHAARR